jgi:hypothetical protein
VKALVAFFAALALSNIYMSRERLMAQVRP